MWSRYWDWHDRTSLHGLAELKHSSDDGGRWWCVGWVLLCLAGMSVAVWQMVELGLDFAHSSHYTSRLSSDVSVSAPFPDVLICNANRINNTLAKSLGLSTEAQSYLLQVFTEAVPVPVFRMQQDQAKLEAAWEDFVFAYGNIEQADQENFFHGNSNGSLDYETLGNSVDILKLLMELAHQCDETLIACWFQGVQFDCCSRTTLAVNQLGVCLQMWPGLGNETEDSVQRFPGVGGGLNLLIDPGLRHYNPDLIVGNNLEEGIALIPTFNVEENAPAEANFVPPGQHAWLSLERRRRSVSQPKFQIFALPCAPAGTLRLAKGNYTEANCFVDCQLQRQVRQCGCVMLSELQNSSAAPICFPAQMADCWGRMAESSQDPAHEEVVAFGDCAAKCLPPCEPSDDVRAKASFAPWVPQGRLDAFTRTLNFLSATTEKSNKGKGKEAKTETEKSEANTTKFTRERTQQLIWADVYYARLEALGVQTLETTPITALISNIGGTLGLWMGASMLTFFQTIYWLCPCFCPGSRRNSLFPSRITPPPPVKYPAHP